MKPAEQMRQLGEQEAMATERVFAEASPTGKFSKRALAPFVAAINKLVSIMDSSIDPLPLPKRPQRKDASRSSNSFGCYCFCPKGL